MDKYIVSARKYRPTNFNDVVGQEALTQTLRNAINNDKLAHAYLFCGPRGVGKTTCARIFAKTINCEHRSANGDACDECESCKSFNEGRSMNIHELDAASNNSVDNMRDLVEQVHIPPQIGKYKVFIIDEVHMLTSGAFNAFLKTLEEPPSYVIFILATTEKQKIIPTILSRCQIYDFKRIETNDIVGQLKRIAEKENIKYEEEALRVIAEKADGGMRDALSTFDQEVSYTNGDVNYQQVIANLNILDYDIFFKLTDNFVHHEISQALLSFNDILSNGFDGRDFIEGLAKHFRNLLVSRDNSTSSLLEVTKSMAERYKNQAALCPVKFIYRALKICNECDLSYRASRNKRLLVELSLIEIAQSLDEDGAKEEPGPDFYSENKDKKLKPLFKQPRDTNKAAQAGVSAKSSAVTEIDVGGISAKTSGAVSAKEYKEPTSTPNPANKKQKVSEVKKIEIISIKGLREKISSEMPDSKDIQNADNVSTLAEDSTDVKTESEPAQNAQFTTEQLMNCWFNFSNELPKEETDIAVRMKSMKPSIDENNNIKIVLENAQVANFMKPIIPKLTDFLRKNLSKSINISTEIAKSTKVKESALNPREQFKMLIKNNQEIKRLNEALEFELE